MKKAERTTNGRPCNEIFNLCIAQTLVNELRESSRCVGWEEMELELCTKC